MKPMPRELAYFGGLTALVLVLVGADLAYSDDPDATSVEAFAEAPATSASQAAPARAARDCGYNPDVPPVEDYASLVSFGDPIKGDPNAPVTVIEYFDPNCPHCRDLYPIMKEVAEQHGDRAKFAYIPFPLWWQDPSDPRYSLAQVEALHAAAQEGKFFEMLEAQLMTDEAGLSLEQLKGIAEEVGMDPERMAHRIENDVYLDAIMEQRRRGAQTGITGMPAVFVNGRLVASDSRTVECLGELIEEAAGAAEVGG